MEAEFIKGQKESLELKKSEIEESLSKFATKNESGDYVVDAPEDLGNEQSENANEVEEYVDQLGVEKSLEEQLSEIGDALAKIDAGTYGKDEETGEMIDMERLKVYPAARTNVKKD